MCAINILALVKYESNGASSRVRFWNLRAGLIKEGCNIRIVPLLSNDILARYYTKRRHSYWSFLWAYLRRLKAILSVQSDTIVWVEKELLFALPLGFERVLGLDIRRCVFDYDDAVFLNYQDHALGVLGRAHKFAYYARNAGHVTVGSEYLLNHMRSCGCNRITKIPSTVLVEKYDQRKHLRRSVTTIGWIGTPVTVQLLETMKPVLTELAKKCSIQLKVVGAQWMCEGVDVVCLPWSEENEAAMVSTFDVGIMPLIDGPWERAKCGYKLIQYMAAGVVPVGSRIGENPAIIQEGVNGFLAGTTAEWCEKLVMLCSDEKLRAEIGENARRKALTHYDVSHAVAAVHQVFGKVLDPNRAFTK